MGRGVGPSGWSRMPSDPLPGPLLDPLPPALPLGVASRYAGLSEDELLAWGGRLLYLHELWWVQLARFADVGVTTVLGGPCARALVGARDRLMTEGRALTVELTMRMGEARAAVAPGSGRPR